MLEEFLKAAKSQESDRPRRGHSALYEWMWEHASVLAAELNPPRRPNWDALARVAAADGLTDGAGKPPTGSTVRQTWWKVRKEKERSDQGPPVRKPRGKRPKVSASAAPVVPVEVRPVEPEGIGDPPKRPRFGVAKLKL